MHILRLCKKEFDKYLCSVTGQKCKKVHLNPVLKFLKTILKQKANVNELF